MLLLRRVGALARRQDRRVLATSPAAAELHVPPLALARRALHGATKGAVAALGPPGLLVQRRGGAACVRASPLRSAVRRKTTESAEQGACSARTVSLPVAAAQRGGVAQVSASALSCDPQSHRPRWQP